MTLFRPSTQSHLARSFTRPETAWRAMLVASVALVLISGVGVAAKIRTLMLPARSASSILAKEEQLPLQLSRVELSKRPAGHPIAADGP